MTTADSCIPSVPLRHTTRRHTRHDCDIQVQTGPKISSVNPPPPLILNSIGVLHNPKRPILPPCAVVNCAPQECNPWLAVLPIVRLRRQWRSTLPTPPVRQPVGHARKVRLQQPSARKLNPSVYIRGATLTRLQRAPPY
jgi:hypothetical protein